MNGESAAAGTARREAPPAEAAHILVVDDDDRLRTLLGRYLRDNGYHVSSASSAADARAKLDGMAFDLIVLDVMMPGESGVDFTRGLRRSTTVPILLLTAMGEPEDRIAGLESGADDYLTKPFEPRELLLRVATILRRTALPPPAVPATCIKIGEFRYFPARDQLLRGDEAGPADDGRGRPPPCLCRQSGRDVEPACAQPTARRKPLAARHRRADRQVETQD